MKKVKKTLGAIVSPQNNLNIECNSCEEENIQKFGHIVVRNLQELYRFPCKLRIPGMSATVVEENYAEFQLKATTESKCNNNNWQVVEVFNPDSVESDKNFIHDQTTPSKKWDILHNLNKKPSVTITDSANTVVEGKIVINDGVRLLIEFNAPFTGTAILN